MATIIKAGLTGVTVPLDAKKHLASLSATQARDALDRLSTKLQTKGGTLSLIHARDPEQALAMERKWGWALSSGQRKQTASVVQALFERAGEGLSASSKEVVQRALTEYLRETSNKVGSRLIHLVGLLDTVRQHQDRVPDNARRTDHVSLKNPSVASSPKPQPSAATQKAEQWRLMLGLKRPGAFSEEFAHSMGSAMAENSKKPVSEDEKSQYVRSMQKILAERGCKVHMGELERLLTNWTTRMDKAQAPHPTAEDQRKLDHDVQTLRQAAALRAVKATELIQSAQPSEGMNTDEFSATKVSMLSRAIEQDMGLGRLQLAMSMLTNDATTSAVQADCMASLQLIAQLMRQAPTDDDRYALKSQFLGQLRDYLLEGESADFLRNEIARLQPFLGFAAEKQAKLMIALEAPIQLSHGNLVSDSLSLAVTQLLNQTVQELLDDSGAVDVQALAALQMQLEISLANTPLRQHMVSQLRHLQTDERLRAMIDTIGAPTDPNGPVARTLRATLGLAAGEVVTEAHARQAVLSALLTPLRQGSVGSCFATAMAIRMQKRMPIELVRDFQQLIENGRLNMALPGAEDIHIPMNTLAGTKVLFKKIALSRAQRDLTNDTGLRAGLRAGGVPEAQITAQVTQALQAVEQRNLQQPIPAHASALTQQPLTTAQEILEEVLLAQRQLTRQDFQDRQELDKLGQKIYTESAALVRLERNPMTPEALASLPVKEQAHKETVEKYAEKRANLDDKLAALQGFDEQLADAVAGFQGATENRLLRVWEYTLSSAAEKGSDNSKLKEFLPILDAFAPVGELGAEFKSLASKHLRFEYDASLQRQLAKDGSSSRGGFVLHFSPPNSDSTGQAVRSQSDLQMALDALILEAGTLRASLQRDPIQQKAIQALALAKSNDVWAPDFAQKLGSATDAVYASKQSRPNRSTPWLIPVGHSEEGLHALRFGHKRKEVTSSIKQMGGADWMGFGAVVSDVVLPEEALVFVIDTLKEKAKSHPGVVASVDADPDNYLVPASVRSHVFSLMPGLGAVAGSADPSFFEAWRDDVIATEKWISSQLKAPSRVIASRPMPLEDARKLIQDSAVKLLQDDPAHALQLGITPKDPRSQAAWLAKVEGAMSGKEPTLQNLRTAMEQAVRQALAEQSVPLSTMNFLNTTSQRHLLKQFVTDENKTVKPVLRIFDDLVVTKHPPPKLVIADTNWGVATKPMYLSVLFNPSNGQSEFWLVNKSAGGEPISRINKDTFARGWSVWTDPVMYGEGGAAQQPVAAR